MKIILTALIATTAAALAQAPAPRSEVAFRAGSTTGIREFTPAAQPTDLGHEILLMQESRPFVVRASVAPSYTSNAFSDFSQRSDWSLDGSLSFGLETVLAGKLLLHAELAATMSRYDQNTSLDRDSFGAIFSAAYAFTERTTLAAAYVGQWYMEPDFSDNYLTFHTLSLRLNHRVVLNERLSMNLTPFANFVSSDPSDYDQFVFGGSLSVIFHQTARVQWGLAAQAQWSDYDSYFRGIFPEDREDFSWSLAAWWAWRCSDRLEMRFDARFARNDSNLRAFNLGTGQFVGLYDYDTWQITPTATVNWQF